MLVLWIENLKAGGLVQKSRHNFSALGKKTSHGHLNCRYVVCPAFPLGKIKIEMHYAGSGTPDNRQLTGYLSCLKRSENTHE